MSAIGFSGLASRRWHLAMTPWVAQQREDIFLSQKWKIQFSTTKKLEINNQNHSQIIYSMGSVFLIYHIAHLFLMKMKLLGPPTLPWRYEHEVVVQLQFKPRIHNTNRLVRRGVYLVEITLEIRSNLFIFLLCLLLS